jgi:hypothetical protein
MYIENHRQSDLLINAISSSEQYTVETLSFESMGVLYALIVTRTCRALGNLGVDTLDLHGNFITLALTPFSAALYHCGIKCRFHSLASSLDLKLFGDPWRTCSRPSNTRMIYSAVELSSLQQLLEGYSIDSVKAI